MLVLVKSHIMYVVGGFSEREILETEETVSHT